MLSRIGFFFFSSRRRHTRCSRDWSSDVCSSDLGFRYATMGGVSIGVEDLEIPAEKSSLLHDAEGRVERFQRAYATGQITFGVRYNKVIDAWTHANNDIADAMENTMQRSNDGFNPGFMMVDTLSRGSRGPRRHT